MPSHPAHAAESVYEELSVDRSQFRLLALSPEIGYGALAGRLIVHRLSQCPPYEAISYHWGSSTTVERISLNEIPVDVSSTAAAALRSCRHASEVVYLWIDQICINQENAIERLAQVMLMGKIYSQAANVNICLDSSNEGIASLFELAKELEAVQSQSWWPSSWWKQRPTVKSSSQPLSMILGPDLELTEQAWSQLARFNDSVESLATTMSGLLEDLWFRRAWVVQEAVLARRLTIACGRQQKVPWDTMYRLVMLQIGIYKTKWQPYTVLAGLRSMLAIHLQRGKTRPLYLRTRATILLRDLQEDLQYPTWAHTFSNITISLLKLWNSVDDRPLLSILRHFRHLESSDGRDKIFGFLGLARSWGVNEIPFAPSPAGTQEEGTAYTATISEVCFAFAFHHILVTGTLDILMATCWAGKAHEDLPFWVPDWSQEPPPCDTEYGCPLRSWPHRAGGDTLAVPQCIAQEKALMLRGVLVDVIDAVIDDQDVIDINTYHNPTHEVWTRWEAFATKAHQSDDPYGGTEDGRFDAFWRTLVYNTNARARQATPADGKRFREWLRGDMNASESSIVTGRILFKQRKIYRTKKGYLGNGCANVQIGDSVFVLRGGRLPFVLREERLVEGTTTATSMNGYQEVRKSVQGYRIIGGDSYVHGICDGEVWRGMGEGLLEQEIALI